MGCEQSIQSKNVIIPMNGNSQNIQSNPKTNQNVQNSKKQQVIVPHNEQKVKKISQKQIQPIKKQKQKTSAKIINLQPKNQVTKKQQQKIQIKPKVQEKIQVFKQQKNKQLKQLPDVIKFGFQKTGQKLLTGKFSTQKTGNQNIPCIKEDDCFQNIGVLSLFYQNFCYTDGNYNNNNYKIQIGKLANREAYRINPPQQKFKKFLASQHCLVFKLPISTDYTIYKFQDNSLDIAAKITKDSVKANSFNLVTELKISQIIKPLVVLIVPSQQKITPFTNLGASIQGATIFKDKFVKIELVKFPLPAEPPLPEDFSYGPGNHYNCYNPNRDLRRFFAKDKQWVIWNDKQKKNFYLSQIDRQLLKVNTIVLKGKNENFILAAAIGNNQNIFYMQIQQGPAGSKNGCRKMQFVKCDYSGNQIMKQAIPTDKQNLNIYNFDTCTLAIDEKSIGMIVSRKMTMHTDGLNHQGAYAGVFDINTLKLIKKFGQTSGHSFSNSLIAKQGGGFIGMDLGDNYPRAIHHFTFDCDKITFKKVYSFKTYHGDQAKSPAGVSYPQYKQISKGNKKFYKWSNDNKTYTQLGAPGVIQHSSGNIIVFGSQNYPSPLDNSQTGDYNNCPRNIGFVKVSSNMLDIISQGPQEKGGFFNFNGGWQVLTNKGVKWLTKLQKQENASRIKAVRVQQKIVIIFQVWSKQSYINTQYMIIDLNGKIIASPNIIPFKIKHHKSDDIYSSSNSVIIYAGGKGKLLNRYQIFV